MEGINVFQMKLVLQGNTYDVFLIKIERFL